MRQSRLAGGYHYLQPEALATACTEIRANTTLMQVVDAFAAVHQAYEALWDGARVVR